MITEHTICALPESNPDWRHYAIKVQRRGNTDYWVVAWSGEYLLLDGGEPAWVMHPGNASQFDEQNALRAAEQLAPELVVGGFTVADALERGAR